MRQVGKTHRLYHRNRERRGVPKWWYVIAVAFERLEYRYENCLIDNKNLWELCMVANRSKVLTMLRRYSWRYSVYKNYVKVKKFG